MGRFDRIRYNFSCGIFCIVLVYFCLSFWAECRFMHHSWESTKKGARINLLD